MHELLNGFYLYCRFFSSLATSSSSGWRRQKITYIFFYLAFILKSILENLWDVQYVFDVRKNHEKVVCKKAGKRMPSWWKSSYTTRLFHQLELFPIAEAWKLGKGVGWKIKHEEKLMPSTKINTNISGILFWNTKKNNTLEEKH